MNTLLVVAALLFTQVSAGIPQPQGSEGSAPHSGPGFAVGGKVIDKSGLKADSPRKVTLSPLVTGTVSDSPTLPALRTIGNALETVVQVDGSFEFPPVQPGPYILRMAPGAPGVRSIRVDVAGDTRNLQLVIPFQLEVEGRVLLEGRRLGPNATVQAVQPSFTSATGIQDNGTFRLRLTEGENQISLARLPIEFFVTKITYGATDITKTPLKVDSRTAAQPIVIRLGSVSFDVNPVKVSGRIRTTGNSTFAGRAAISLEPVGPEGKPVDTTTKADGSFEFEKVTRGTYVVRAVSPLPGESEQPIVVGDRDVHGLEVVIPLSTEVGGKVSVVDPRGQPLRIHPNISVHFRVSSEEFSWTFVREDGTFTIPLDENQYTTTVTGLPAGYAIKSISAGRLNLLRNPLVIDGKQTPAQIEIVLEYRPSARP
jgi:hypothetical protein